MVYNFDTLQDGYKAISRLNPGDTFTAFYLFGGHSVYKVGQRGSRKTMATADNCRPRVFSTPSSVKHIIGRPCRIEIA